MQKKAERIYKRIMAVFPELCQKQVGHSQKLESGSYMPLSLDVLDGGDQFQIIALAHNGLMNGDIMADPDMQIYLNHKLLIAQAMTYQNDYVGCFDVAAILTENGRLKGNLSKMKDLNNFLHTWTKNIIDQGFKGG